jgi:hypothetical protein
MHGGMNTLVSNLIGTGITPGGRSMIRIWKKSFSSSGWTGPTKRMRMGCAIFCGLQALAARERIDSGESFVRFRPRYHEDGLSVPLQPQLIQSDHLDETYNTPSLFIHFPAGIEDEYFKQLTGEKLVTPFKDGVPKKVWVQTRPRVEALDCEVYAYAAAVLKGLSRMTDDRWDELERMIVGSAAPEGR